MEVFSMQKIDQACVNTLRFLAADQVEKAKSGASLVLLRIH